MSRKVVSISFLYAGERVRIGVDKNGKFPLPKIRKKLIAGSGVSYMHPYTAKQFVEHDKIKNADPVITLSDGSKLRVYLSADPTGAVIESMSVIENHDQVHGLRAKLLRNSKKTPKSGRNKKTVSDSKDDFSYSFFDLDFDDYDVD